MQDIVTFIENCISPPVWYIRTKSFFVHKNISFVHVNYTGLGIRASPSVDSPVCIGCRNAVIIMSADVLAPDSAKWSTGTLLTIQYDCHAF